jgi:hypothetical protein
MTPDRTDVVRAQVPEEDLVGVIELLSFVINLIGEQSDLIDTAMYYFTYTHAYASNDLAEEATELANRLARALGFADLNFGFVS